MSAPQIPEHIDDADALLFFYELLDSADKAQEFWEQGQAIRDLELREEFYLCWIEGLVTGDFSKLRKFCNRRIHRPATIEQFLFDPFYLGVPREEVWPEILVAIQEANSGKYIEALLTGPIGTAKTTIALYTQAYQLYLLSCYYSPQQELGIQSTDEIFFIFQNMNKTLAKEVDYNRFRALMEGSNYFTKVWKFVADIESELRFPNRVKVKPLSGLITASIGQNVYGGVLDELNFMSVIKKSATRHDNTEVDQAKEIYNSISIRRQSRFMSLGKMPGVLCMVSSRNYPGQFTDTKEEEARRQLAETGESTIYVYDKKLWELKPWAYSGEMFKMFIGGKNKKPRILSRGEKILKSDAHLVMEIPVEHKASFEKDPMVSLRDIAGVATLARYPFIIDTDAIGRAFKPSLKSVFSEEAIDFQIQKLKLIVKRMRDPRAPRAMHVDLSLTTDSCGVAVGHVPKFVEVEKEGKKEILPVFGFDGMLEVTPPLNGEIQFSKVRRIAYLLTELGVNLRWITFDSYQSYDSLQILKDAGYVTGTVSVDTSIVPYTLLKDALYDGRVIAPPHEKAALELASLERLPKEDKVDHPPTGSKDISDAMAGVAYTLYTRRMLWMEQGIMPTLLPEMGNVAKMEDDA